MHFLLTALERRTLLTKLVLCFSVLLGLAMVNGVLNLLAQKSLAAELEGLYNLELAGISNAKDAQMGYLAIGRELRHALLVGPGPDREAAIKAVHEADAQLHREILELKPRIFREENVQRLAIFEREYATYKKNVDKAIALIARGENAQATALVASAEFRTTGVSANRSLADVSLGKEQGAKQATERTLALMEQSVRLTYALLGGGVLLVSLFGWVITLSIRGPSERLRAAVERLAGGDLNVVVPHTDYHNETGGLACAVQVLQQGAQTWETQSWIKSSLAQVSGELQTVTSFADLSQRLFSTIAPLIHIGHGVFYVYEEERRRLRLLGAYAYRERKSLEQYFEVGQGLVGQCAMERRPIILTQPPANYVRIGSSLGDATPRAIAVLPIVRNDRLLGVLELATFESFGAKEQALLDGLLPVLAMNVDILERNAKTHKLLEETRAQATAMQEQAATLEEQAVELEAQQDALKDTEAWYRSIIESAPDGMLVSNARGTITLANPKLEAMFGYAVGELTGQPIETLVPDTLRGAHVSMREGYAAKGTSREMGALNRDLQGVRKDGSRFAVEVGLSKLPVVGGRGMNVCATVRDITDRKAAEHRIATLEERGRLILGSVNEGIVGLDAQGLITFVNPAVTLLLGYSEADLLGRNMHALMHHSYPDGRDFPRSECSMYLTATDGQPRTVDSEALWHQNGTAIPVEYSTTPVFKDGALTGTVIAFRDISERKSAQERIRHANMMSDSALDLTRAGYWLIDYRDPEYYTSSERAAAIFGEHPTEGWRYHLTDEWYSRIAAADPSVAEATGAHYAAAVEGTVPRYDFTYCYKRPVDGQIAWIRAIGSVTRDKNGKALFMYGVAQDVTELRLSEANLKERMDELERFQALTIDREERMIALKVEINALLQRAGLPAKYKIVE